MNPFKSILRALRCLYLKDKMRHLREQITMRQAFADTWPITRESWEVQLSMMQGEIDAFCGKKNGGVVRALMPSDRR